MIIISHSVDLLSFQKIGITMISISYIILKDERPTSNIE